jgi:hypothetical protein
MGDLPPDLSRLGGQLTTAIDDSLRRRRLIRSLLSRIGASGGVGALLFFGIAAAPLHPADIVRLTPALTVEAMPAVVGESQIMRLECDLPEHGSGGNSCVEVALPMATWKAEQLSG